jgi:uncharacterized HAD superfamily protein
MKNELKRMFEIQKDFNKELINIKSLKKKEESTKEFVLAVINEANELLTEINWASWKTKREIIEGNICEELIDIVKFALNIAIIWGIDEVKLFEEFERKSQVVVQRKKQNEELAQIKKMKKKVCAIDLDGVIVSWPNCFIDFVNKRLSKKFTNLYDMKKALPNKKYILMKHEYRISGIKQRVPCIQGSKAFIDNLRKLGYSIVILTARPYKQYFRIFADTKICLDNNGIKYEAILFDESKHIKIVKEFPKLRFMVEDSRNIANEVGAWGYKCFLIDNIYNQGDLEKNVIRVKSFKEILEHLKSTRG